MGLKDLDIGLVMQRLADKRIEDAMAEGKFDNLPGAGQPVVIDEGPLDEDARALWWSLRILRQNDVVPEEIRVRKTIDNLKSQLTTAHDDARVRTLVEQINELAHRFSKQGTLAIDAPIVGADLETELTALSNRTR